MPEKQSYLIVETACFIGKVMLQSGAEIYRVEQTIYRLCKAYGIDSIQCSVNPSVITASFSINKKPQTIMLRAKGMRLDLNKVELMNSLSRSVVSNPVPLKELQKRAEEISHTKPYHPLITALAAGVGTGTYTLIANGTMLDFLCGFLMGFLLRMLVLQLSKYGFLDIFSRFFAGAIASLLGGVFVLSGFATQWELVTISALTLLFPGLLFTNALRDVATGDFVSAVTHATEAFSIAAALASGAALVHNLFLQLGVTLI